MDCNAEMDVEARLREQENWDDRTVRLLGPDRAAMLAQSSVLVIGLGGVGGYAAEMLLRSGVGSLTLVDADEVAHSNLNRQIIALRSSLGQPKALLFAERFHDINPEAEVNALNIYVSPQNASEIISSRNFDYVIDAIDTVAPKTEVLLHCLRNKVPVISSMGAGGRVDVTKIGYFDIWDTREDGLARTVRRNLRKAGMRHPLKVVASTEKPMSHSLIELDIPNKKSSYGTLATIPSIFGIMLANHVIRSIARV